MLGVLGSADEAVELGITAVDEVPFASPTRFRRRWERR